MRIVFHCMTSRLATRIALLALTAFVAALSASGPPLAAQARQPARRNVIFILSDDHRYDFMSFMPGAPAFLQTPALDRWRSAARTCRTHS